LVQDTQFRNNSAINGGAVSVVASNVLLSRVTCAGNAVLRSGGCFYGTGASNISVSDCTFIENHTGADNNQPDPRPSGGAIALFTSGMLTVSSSSFLRNGPAIFGGALVTTGRAVLQINSSTFMENLTTLRGGAVHCDAGDLRIYDSWFEGNMNTGTGPSAFVARGAALNAHPVSDFSRFIETTLVNNTFFRNVILATPPRIVYGSVHVGLRSVMVQGCSFLNNTGFALSGLSLVSNPQSAVDSCIFRGNIGQQGASFLLGSNEATTTISNSLFEENQAPSFLSIYGVFGAGIYLADITTVAIANTSFIRNQCDAAGLPNVGRGCAIVSLDSAPDSEISITGSRFHQNTYLNGNATVGFVITVQQVTAGASVRLFVASTNFTENVYSSRSMTYLDDGASCGVVNTYAPLGSSGFFNVTAEYRDCIFDKNVGQTGASICAQDAHVRATGCRFTNNRSRTPFSGAVALAGSANIVGGSSYRIVFDSNYWANNRGTRAAGSSTLVTDFIANAFIPEKIIDVTFINNTFADSPPPGAYDSFFVGNIQLVGVYARFLQPSTASPTDPIKFPSLGTGFNSTLDATTAPIDIDMCRFWHGGPVPVTTTILIGDYDLVCRGNSTLCSGDVIGSGAGKLVFADRGDLAICDDYSPRFINAIMENRGILEHWNSTIQLVNSSLINANGSTWRFPLWSNPATLTAPAGDSYFLNFGTLKTSILIMENVHMILDNATSVVDFQITNYWDPAGFHIRNGSTADLGGKIQFQSNPIRLYTELVYNQSLPVVFAGDSSSFIFHAWPSSTFFGGYYYEIDYDVTKNNVSARAVGLLPLSALMSADGQTVVLSFPRRTKAAAIGCSDILASSTLAALDSSPVCTWVDTTTLSIRSTRFPATLQFVPGGVVDAVEPQFQWRYQLEYPISLPSSPVPPMIILSSPDKVSGCSDAVLDARSSSTRGDPALARYSWSMLGNSDAAALSSTIASADGPLLLLPASIFPPEERNYTICLNISNSMRVSSKACIALYRIGALLPSVFIEGPSLRSPLALDAIALHARVDPPACVSSVEIQRQWVQISGPSPSSPPVGTTQFSLFLTAGSLSPQADYVFEFRAWINISSVASQRVTIRARASDLVMVSTGASGLVSGDTPLNMSVAVLDPNAGFSLLPTTAVRLQWDLLSCPGRASDGVISASALAAAFLSRNSGLIVAGIGIGLSSNSSSNQTDAASVLCRDITRSVRLAPTSGYSFFINNSAIPLGEYLFGVSAVAVDNRTARAVVSVLVASRQSYSKVQFRGSQYDFAKILPQEKFAITALVDGSSSPPSSGSLSWVDELQSPGIIASSSTSEFGLFLT
jgi:hypothetical protein